MWAEDTYRGRVVRRPVCGRCGAGVRGSVGSERILIRQILSFSVGVVRFRVMVRLTLALQLSLGLEEGRV